MSTPQLRDHLRAAGIVAGALAAFAFAPAAWSAMPQASAFLVKADGRTLWSKDPDRPLPPASLTKLMTALLVVEALAGDAIVTVDSAAAGEGGGRIGLRAGERMMLADLLAAMLIQSANDACRALADHVAGDEQRFVALMNARASSWGLTHTHYANACGHDQPNHYASAADLAELAERALAQPLIARLVALPSLVIHTTDTQRRFTLHNRNFLIGRYRGAVGVKTGSTPAAGRCLIAAARQDGHSVLLVMLNATDRWRDALRTIEHAFTELELAP